MTWDTPVVVDFVERFCGTSQYIEPIFFNCINGKLLLYLTIEGWNEIGIKSVAHRYALVGWSKRVLEGGSTFVPKNITLPSFHTSQNVTMTSQSEALEYNLQPQEKTTLPDLVSDSISSHVVIPLNGARPITYDRIFYPRKVKEMYSTVGKSFLIKYYREAWASFNKGMVNIRELFEMGFCGQDKEDFSSINLRNSREKSNQILEFIKENMKHIPPLDFGKLGLLPWRVEDVYMKVLEHRNYIRKCGKEWWM
ncbi:hypothetical protein GOP47_0014374 [Adiantum capillus-veneris]|uniref:SAM domain-containing protein n=1 Tax=Adiantum capillus-veneris TaxID=13818 RepID=A0A9D4ZET0_ADICA|nr:hypothetical protein GOP47_0014374 [Adiantum capillus-veneris]